jgi:hypothetical protein
MRLVEQHRINRHDPRFTAIDAAAFASKNLYNAALYHTRQAFIFRAERISYPHLMRFRMAAQIIHRLHRFRRLYIPNLWNLRNLWIVTGL